MGTHRRRAKAAREERFNYLGKCLTTGKVIFSSRKAAKQNKQFYRADVRIYVCPHCDGIHLGHGGGYDRQQHRDWNTV